MGVKRPRILITRPKEQEGEFLRLLEAQGLEAVSFPTIEILPPEDWGPLDRAIQQVERYQWLLFTSVNGVKYFFRRWGERRGDPLPPIRIAAIGPATAEALRDRGLQVHFIPRRYRAEELARGLIELGIRGQRLLLPRAKEAREVLPEMLRAAGAEVEVVEAYRASRPRDGERLRRALEGVDMVAFTSSQAARNFFELLGDKGPEVAVAAIGPVTAQTLRDLGISPQVVPRSYTVAALAEAIGDYFRRRVEDVPIDRLPDQGR
ncbi:MAG: hypothetical protein DRG55_05115 [Deltaproteobacteria bacterium]|nr:MAG: hypothetical protein DRG55_05115 [Deltaproteobacteria bacterium]